METEKDLREFAHIWDGSEEWGLSAHYWTRVTLTAIFSGESPSVEELAALRRLREEFRALPIKELKALLNGKGEVELGHFSSMEAHEIEERASQLQVPFEVQAEGESGVDYLPIHYLEGEQFALIIEDEDLAKRVTSQMLQHGVPIIAHIEE